MTKIRIGNDVNVVWRFRTPEGAAYPLTGEYTLLLINRWKREAISVFDVAGDEIRTTIRGATQFYMGEYRLELKMKGEDGSYTTLDTCDLFELVPQSCCADVAGGPTEVVCESVLNLPEGVKNQVLRFRTTDGTAGWPEAGSWANVVTSLIFRDGWTTWVLNFPITTCYANVGGTAKTKLAEVELPDCVEVIESGAFYSSSGSSWERVKLPRNLREIKGSQRAFKRIEYGGTLAEYLAIDFSVGSSAGGGTIEDLEETTVYTSDVTMSFAGTTPLPDGLEKIGAGHIIPVSSVEQINGISRCTLDFPATLKTIGDDVKTTSVLLDAVVAPIHLPEGLVSIGQLFLNGESVYRVHFPSTITAIGNGVLQETPIQYRSSNNIADMFGDYAGIYFPSLADFCRIDFGGTLTIWSVTDTPYFDGKEVELTEDGVLVIPKIDRLGNYTFVDASFEAVDLRNVAEIGNFAFYSNTRLKTVRLNDERGHRRIGSQAFYGCTNAEFESICAAQVLYRAFYNCKKCYARVDVGDLGGWGVEPEIGEYAFYQTNVSELRTNANVGGYAFNYCRNLQSVEFYVGDGGRCTQSVGTYAFRYAEKIQSVTAPADVFCAMDFANEYATVFYNSSGAILYLDGAAQEGELVIPDNVKRLGNYTFDAYTKITSVVIPDTVEEIGSNTFLRCTSLTNAVVGAGVKKMGSGIFTYCSALTHVYMKPTVPPVTGYNNFGNTNSALKIRVPMGSLEAYQTASIWSTDKAKMYESEE